MRLGVLSTNIALQADASYSQHHGQRKGGSSRMSSPANIERKTTRNAICFAVATQVKQKPEETPL